MSTVIAISDSAIRHTYPFGAHDKVMEFSTATDMYTTVHGVFASEPRCRRIVVGVNQDDIEQIAECEAAGLRFVVNVRLRDGTELSLMVAEPAWVTAQSTDTKDLTLQ